MATPVLTVCQETAVMTAGPVTPAFQETEDSPEIMVIVSREPEARMAPRVTSVFRVVQEEMASTAIQEAQGRKDSAASMATQDPTVHLVSPEIRASKEELEQAASRVDVVSALVALSACLVIQDVMVLMAALEIQAESDLLEKLAAQVNVDKTVYPD